MPTEDELFAAVDDLLAGEPEFPDPAERLRLREAAAVTKAALAKSLQTTAQTVTNWESGRSEPRPPRRGPYLRLLQAWAERHPVPGGDDEALPGAVDQRIAREPLLTESVLGRVAEASAAVATAAPAEPSVPVPAPVTAGSAAPVSRPVAAVVAPRVGRQAPAAERAKSATGGETRSADRRFPHGPLLVLDGDGTAYGVGGILLDCPATTIPALVDWTLSEAGIGAERLHRHGKDADPLVALTESAAVKLGLPTRLEGEEARRSLRLPADHKVVKQIARAKWQLTKRGFGPWARVYRPASGQQRACVQFAILPWDALDTRTWGQTADQHPADIARVLGTYATRVITPRGSSAVSGLELMTAMRPPTRAAKDETTGSWVSAPNPGALTAAVDPAPPEAPGEHPVAQDWKSQGGGFLDEEAYQWIRDPQLLTDEECVLPYAVGLDINTAFLAAASRLAVGLGRPQHVVRPVFDKKIPGSWLVDLSHLELDPRLPSPFTPKGTRPDGPAWYATPTVAYAQELGADIQPLEGFLRRETGAYLDPWHDRLKNAYVATMADLGVPAGKDIDERAFLEAMEHHKQTDPALAAVLSAIKATVKGGIGKLRERPQGRHYRDGERWAALERPTWRPDIRAAVISKARVNMHRKLANTARMTGLYPLAVLSDCVVYPSKGPSPLDFLPLTSDGHVAMGTFRLGATPGLAKVEGVQDMFWAVDLLERGLNPARHIKGGDAVLDEGE